MNFPKLKIGNLTPKFPIIQGGMAIRVSMAKLAAAVANEGGVGVIAGTGLKLEELANEIKKAKEMTKGIIGVNIMFAATDFVELVKTSIESGIDLIISGAGFSRDVFAMAKEAKIPFLPIVSSVKLAKISERLGASAIIVEGGNAGGHLGTDKDSWDIVKDIKEAVKIPVIGAGGVVTPEDAQRMFDLGLDGVQMGTRFVASKEVEISDVFKELYIKSKKEDVVEIMSSAGLPANAIKTKFTNLVLAGKAPKPENCTNCLKHCSRKFCIKDALNRGHDGDLERGVFFTGKDVWKIHDILSVKEIFQQFINYKAQ
ncbi:NAD(P)H-dependent flavin oxidoreductase [Haliovirga abyssi]|uniref:2-nitropropane dioxygenase n=1 Tax=Haliovirga abyssi TaxID=2996794 RepID=A0AAU9DPM1_9FUSO|nr:nitronate monooxygenase [Haliovirga abyssi]BDU50383.1 2-nitropropane dioxygenase [Haliovirga abyssi]